MDQHDALIEALSGSIVTDSHGTVKYLNRHGQLHRTAGPAVIHPNGTESWYQYGKRHRVGGPAIVFSNGVCAWFLNGEKLNEREYVQLIDTGNYLEPRCLI